MAANIYPLHQDSYRRPDKLPEAPPPFAPQWGNALVEEQQVQWLVPNLIPSGTATLLTGASFLGKTFLMQHLMIACALGKPWLGIPVTQCKTFAIFSEDRSDVTLNPRRNRILESYGATPVDLDPDLSAWLCACPKNDFDFDPVLFKCRRFHSGGEKTPLWDYAISHCKELGCGLLIIDNATTCLDGPDPDHVKAFCRMLMKTASQMGISIVLLHHPPKSGESLYAGSANWERSFRHVLSLERPKSSVNEYGDDDGKRVLRLHASNLTGEYPRIHLLKDKAQQGMLVPDDPPPEVARRWPLSRAEKQDLDYKVLAAIRTVIERGGEVFSDATHPRSISSRSRGWSGWQHVSREQIDDSVDRLVKGGHVVRVGKLVRPA